MCKNHNSILSNYRVIALCKFFTMNFCPGHNFQSIEASNLKLHTQIDYFKDKGSVQEP